MIVIGHRGCGAPLAENTLAAFRHALDCGAEGIEFDVRLLGDTLIVLHDATVDRTTDGQGHYKSMTLAALRRLRTAAGEPVPLLTEVLDSVAGAGLINIEIKEPGIATRVVAALADYPEIAPRVLLSSFDNASTAWLGAHLGGMRLGVLYEYETFDAALARAQRLRAWSLHLPLADVDPARVARVHAAGVKVLVYTVNADAEFAHCLAAGVDGVFTDAPERALAARHSFGAAETQA